VFLCVFVHSGVQHISYCVFVCLCIVVCNTYRVVFLFCLSSLVSCCQFLYFVHSSLPLWFHLTFIYPMIEGIQIIEI
jgi:hypothetical protein